MSLKNDGRPDDDGIDYETDVLPRPFINPVWSEFTSFGSKVSILLAMALVAIL